jgi:fucose 4-O-acetylase-like acetyltransferase
MLNNQYITALIIAIFFVLTWCNFIITEYNSIIIEKLLTRLTPLILGFTGTTIVFNFFIIYQESFTQATRLGHVLQYIGKRTLDIYLLHYFLIPKLPLLGNIIKESNSMVIEIICGLGVSMFVIVFCLIISNIIRTSKFLEFILFGVKRK